MKLPKVDNIENYIGLYVVDFGAHSGVGFTAQEVAELLESEKFKSVTVYKIHNARPDGTMELKGVVSETFQLETGMFFYSDDISIARSDFSQLTALAERIAPPARAKVHLAKYDDDRYVTAVIYPAEYNDEFSRWLLDGDYKTAGPAQGGVDAVRQYYDMAPEILERLQLFAKPAYSSKTGRDLLRSIRAAVQR